MSASSDPARAALEGSLVGLAADLVSGDGGFTFYDRLFSAKPGIWLDLESLIEDIPKMEMRLLKIQHLIDGPVLVTWLELYEDYDNSGYHRKYVSVIFFQPGTFWSWIAIHNKSLYDEDKQAMGD